MSKARPIRSRLDYPHVVSTLALVISVVTGSAYALSVNSGDIVDDTIRSRDVKNQDLTTKDIQEQSLLFPTHSGSIKPGQTVRGVIGARDNVGSSASSVTAFASLPAPNYQLLHDNNVVVNNGSDETSNQCKGTAFNPTAPKGVVCVYTITSSNATNIRGLGMQEFPIGTASGFRIAWEPTAANALTAVEAVWAFTGNDPG